MRPLISSPVLLSRKWICFLCLHKLRLWYLKQVRHLCQKVFHRSQEFIFTGTAFSNWIFTMELWTGSLCAAVISRRVSVDLPNPPSHNEQMNEIEIFFFYWRGQSLPPLRVVTTWMELLTEREGGKAKEGREGGKGSEWCSFSQL